MARKQWHPPTYDDHDVIAIQTIARYAAGESDVPPSQAQCRRMLDWLVIKACSTYEDPFEPGCEDIRLYMMGRRSVGLALVKLMSLNLGIFKKDDNDR